MRTVEELCPHCDSLVMLEEELKAQPCPECGENELHLEILENDYTASLIDDNGYVSWESKEPEVQEAKVICRHCGEITTDFDQLYKNNMEVTNDKGHRG